jgi:hypothetical protein
MLKRFNGARLFIDAVPMASIFGISFDPPPSALEWASDQWIDKVTPVWRAGATGSGLNRQGDFAIAMTLEGMLIILGRDERVREWDTDLSQWTGREMTFADWIKEVLQQGDRFLREG